MLFFWNRNGLSLSLFMHRHCCHEISHRDASSLNSNPTQIKATKAPPKIIRKQFSEGHVDCKVNQQMILEVPVEGAPAPETSWWRDDAEVKSDDLIKV